MADERIGLIGLAVMGQSLSLNLADHGYEVVIFNRTAETTRSFIDGNPEQSRLIGTAEIERFVGELDRPRRIVLMVKAGEAVEAVLAHLVPRLDAGDVIVDGGNSFWADSERRSEQLATLGIRFLGTGISGGEQGARFGPSIMPGGNGWEEMREPLTAIAAKVDGEACCDWIGPGGSGHYVKMIHNGIEYADMQVIAEAYHLLRASGRSAAETAAVFRRFGEGSLSSYLMDITAQILEVADDDGEPLVEKILDAAAQKGTGRWTVEDALSRGQPTTVIAEAVLARSLSALKDERVHAASRLRGPSAPLVVEEREIEQALLASKIVCYAQGFMLIRACSGDLSWALQPARIAPLWRGGCIIRARMLNDITSAYRNDPELSNLLLDSHFADVIDNAQAAWRNVIAAAAKAGIPVPAYSAALSFYDGFRTARLPANLIQAQRDFFGAHTYERVDRDRGEHFHTQWAPGAATTPSS
ncbi:MAG: decarboxylating NADP(+)-dependent phosphogluconate dehydrogenase [Actinomycetota bacterium]|nr:decarboxylating NADP(+)-dependent phosphogluconate dehydrogenase [Actinomycetota bacterium]